MHNDDEINYEDTNLNNSNISSGNDKDDGHSDESETESGSITFIRQHFAVLFCLNTQIPLLTAKEEFEYGSRAQQGDERGNR